MKNNLSNLMLHFTGEEKVVLSAHIKDIEAYRLLILESLQGLNSLGLKTYELKQPPDEHVLSIIQDVCECAGLKCKLSTEPEPSLLIDWSNIVSDILPYPSSLAEKISDRYSGLEQKILEINNEIVDAGRNKKYYVKVRFEDFNFAEQVQRIFSKEYSCEIETVMNCTGGLIPVSQSWILTISWPKGEQNEVSNG